MAAWLTVYAPQPVDALDLEFLTACVHDPILGDIGESWGFDYDDTLRLLRRCEVHPLRGAADESYSIVVPDRRPVEFTRLVEPARIDEERDEALQTIEQLRPASRTRVEGLLESLAEVVMLELGWPALDREEFILAWYAALELAESAGGLLKDYEERWWDPADRTEALE